MSNLQKIATEGLLETVVTAQEVNIELVSDLPEDGSAQALETSLDFIEEISSKAGAAGYVNLKIIAEDLHTHLGAATGRLSVEAGNSLADWFGDVLLHIESPEDSDTLERILKPLPADIVDETRKDIDGIPDVKPVDLEAEDATDNTVVPFAELAPETSVGVEPGQPDSDTVDMPVDTDTEALDPSIFSDNENESSPSGPDAVEMPISDTDANFDWPTEEEIEKEAIDSSASEATNPSIFAVNEDENESSLLVATAADMPIRSEADESLDWPSETASSFEEDDEIRAADDVPVSSDTEANFDWPAEQETTSDAAQVSSADIAAFDSSIFDDDDAMDFGEDSVLGILASELYDISRELNGLADSIASTEDASELIESVGNYLELVSRVYQVSESLELQGLVLVCDFVNNNILLIAELPVSERVNALEVLKGWPQVIIDHLAEPKNDDLCLAVVDYLEKENWPEPLPYREVRELIEGLTHELELTGDYEVEPRQSQAQADDVELEISADSSPSLIEAFFAETPSYAENFSTLMEAIASGEDIQSNVEAAQRIAHTLKGSGNLVGVKGIANLAHHIEDIFEFIAKKKITPPAALARTMQEAADTIEIMLEFLQNIAPAPDEAQRVLQDVLDWANRIDSGNLDFDESEASAKVVTVEDTEATVLEADKEEPIIPVTSAETEVEVNRRASDAPGRRIEDAPVVPGQARAEAIRVPTAVLDNVFRIVGETAIAIGQIQEHLKRLEAGNKLVRKNDGALQQRRYELENLVSIRGMAARHRTAAAVGGDSRFDPLEMDEYDEFYGATHAYIEGVTDSREILTGISDEVSDLNNLFLLQQRLNKELQQVVMTTRMVPVSNIAARLHRAVRQVCRATGKQAELVIIGETLLIDGEVLNKLADPLMHMLRNAVDHSIEAQDERLKKSKPETGKITLDFQQQGNNVSVTCDDDGAGLNYERIRKISIERGLMTSQQAIDNQALARMILQSGFSTSDKLTQISGRGVGMDVVNNTIQSLNGSMVVGDAKPSGTRVSLRLPITLLTSHCLLVGVGEDSVYAIPTSTLSQILSPGTGRIGDVGGKQSFHLEQKVHPALSLNSLLGFPDNVDEANKTVLLLQAADGMTAITVDRVESSFDLVLKNMGAFVKEVQGVAGVSTLGDGSVVTVLDLASMIQRKNVVGSVTDTMAQEDVVRPIDSRAKLPKVMVVDDSLSVRNSLSQLMGDGGYRVVSARDGLEAVDMLDKEEPDIVLTDLEMPRMNGLELVNFIRQSERWKPMPIVMITSRTMAKHRQQAEDAGVNTYITKPFTEDDVLASIDQHLVPA